MDHFDDIYGRLARLTATTAKMRELHEAMVERAAGANHPVTAELAREVLAGHLTMREAATSAAYRDTIDELANARLQTLQELGDGGELQRHADDKSFDDLIAMVSRPDRPVPDPPAAAPPVFDQDDELSGSIMSGPAPVDRAAPCDETPRRARWQRRW